MSGSGTILQALLPGKSGETVQKSGSLKKSDQSFAAVYEKKIQVHREKSTLLASASKVRDRQQAANERLDDERAVKSAQNADKPVTKNPAKEKMKELVKKAKDTLEAMKDPDVTPEKLKELANQLNSTLEDIKALAETIAGQASTEGTDNQALLKSAEALGATQVVATQVEVLQESATDGNVVTGSTEGVQKTEQASNRQASELNANPMLKDLEKVIETQTDLIGNDPELKAILKQALTEIKAIQDIEATKPEVQSSEKLEDLLGKLNGIVVKVPEVKTEATAAEDEGTATDASNAIDEVPAVSAATPSEADTGTQNQQAASEDSQQANQSQEKQAYVAETPKDLKDAEQSDQVRTSPEKPTAPIEKLDGSLSKTASQTPLQTVQNPQAFQDTLDAVTEGVQAKNQFQSRIMDQVVETVKMNFKGDDGKSEMIMKLKPESLGNVALKLSIEKGIVMAELQVESQAVKQALESNLQDLRNALQDKGFNVFELDVSVRKDNQQQQGSNSGKSSKNGVARVENSVERLAQRMMSLESVQSESTFDYLG